MGRPHRSITKQEYAVLYNQVNGLCPLCHSIIEYMKNGQLKHCENVAHIFPLNPTIDELTAYGGLPRLSNDVDSIDNLILLCPNCHTKYDSVPTKEDYLRLFNLKKEMIEVDSIRNTSFHYEIDDEIRSVIDRLYEMESEKIPLQYDAVKVDQKLGSDFDCFMRQKITDDIVDYYPLIRQLFAEKEKEGLAIFELIASQIRTTYLQMRSQTLSKELIFSKMCEWFSEKTGSNATVSKIMIAFFIQDCEVFDVSK